MEACICRFVEWKWIMSRKLDCIKIKGYKSIRAMELELNSLNILIGANGSGKTNFISLFTLLRQIIEENLQLYVGQSGGSDTFLYFGQQITDEIVINLAFGKNGYDCTLIPAAGDVLIFADEYCWYLGPGYSEPYTMLLGKGHKETNLYAESRSQSRITIVDHVLRSIRSWRVYHFHDTSSTAKLKQTGDINDNRVLHPDASNLAAYLYLLQETQLEYYQQIVDTIQMVAPFFDDFALRPSPFNENKIRLEWHEKGSDIDFDASYLSDGTLRFICLATLLLQPNLPATILIDEPELGLHPYAITVLANLLRSAATQTQVIVSTQSVPLVNQFVPEDIIVVDRKDEQSAFERRNTKDLAAWLDDYGVGDLWEKNLLGGRPQ
jgi:predicted ATPase